uniref:RxLR effector protein n=1 Tax=Peronospora matthiolae TaxID=2874970 RepID=A0AAV1U5X9_9STRA
MSKLFLLVVLALVECARSDALSATSDGQLTKLATPNEDLATQSEQDGKRILRATGARTPSGGWDGLLPYANSKIKANYGAVSKMSKKSGHKKKPAKGLFRKKKKPFGTRVMDKIIFVPKWVVKQVVAFLRIIFGSK